MREPLPGLSRREPAPSSAPAIASATSGEAPAAVIRRVTELDRVPGEQSHPRLILRALGAVRPNRRPMPHCTVWWLNSVKVSVFP